MKVTCEREKLLHAFQTVASVVPTRTTKPILDNVKLEVTPERATVMATDLEVGIRMDVAGFDVQAVGNVVLPIRRFASILRESSDENLSVESDGKSRLDRQYHERQDGYSRECPSHPYLLVDYREHSTPAGPGNGTKIREVEISPDLWYILGTTSVHPQTPGTYAFSVT